MWTKASTSPNLDYQHEKYFSEAVMIIAKTLCITSTVTLEHFREMH